MLLTACISHQIVLFQADSYMWFLTLCETDVMYSQSQLSSKVTYMGAL